MQTRRPYRPLRSQRGQALILAVTVVSVLILAGVSVFSTHSVRQAQLRVSFTNRFLTEEATSTAFLVMESALRRRLWESPPDKNCLKSTDMKVSGVTEFGLKWEVTAEFDPKIKVYTLRSKGQYRGVKSEYTKHIKVLDTSDFLFYNVSTQSFNISNNMMGGDEIAGFIGGRRRVYTKGAITFSPGTFRDNAKSWTKPTPVTWPEDFCIVVQGERIEVAKGFSYRTRNALTRPEDPSDSALYMFDISYVNEDDEPPKYLNQWGHGWAVIHNDYVTIRNLAEAVSTGTPPAGLSRNDIKKHAYPIALFGGDKSLPLFSDKSSDDGKYYGDLDSQIYLSYYAGYNYFFHRGNHTCLVSTNPAHVRSCSSSEVFPKGFAKWREDAEMEGTLMTSESPSQSFEAINWDNMEALKEDAQACGAVVAADQSPNYRDCPVWDSKFMAEYGTTGSTNNCLSVSKFELKPKNLKNFTMSHYTNKALQDRLLRRIVYAEGNIEIEQTDQKGLMTEITNRNARERAGVWIVGENLIHLKGNQFNDTAVTPGSDERREVVFNADGTVPEGSSKALNSINLLLLSPETIHLLSEHYKPMTPAHMKEAYTTKNNLPHPVIPDMYDYERNENDSFKFGTRRFRIENALVLSNPYVDTAAFRLQGNWTARDTAIDRDVRNICALNNPGKKVALPGDEYDESVHGDFPLKKSNRFWKMVGGKKTYPKYLIPAVFENQDQYSFISFKGLRVLAEFDPTNVAGKRNLNVSNYRFDSTIPVDLTGKRYVWDHALGRRFKEVAAPGAQCKRGNIFYAKDDVVTDRALDAFYVNHSEFFWQQSTPPDSFTGLGSLFGVQMPMLQVSQ